VRYGEGLRSVDLLFNFFEVKLLCKIKVEQIKHININISLGQDWALTHGQKNQLCEKLFSSFGVKDI